jgi:peptidoglycan/LPS O-acetylase OafA/YrhL
MSVEVPSRSRQERVWFAHAIRGPACLLVVFTHLFHLFPNEQALVAGLAHFEPAADLPSVPWAGALRFLDRQEISTGTLGVLLFFLVSGFVIPFSLQHGRPGAFFVRRVFRLYPTLWVCLLVTVAVLTVQSQVQGSALPYGTGEVGANALLVSPYTWLPWIEPVLWSLAIEELFYVIAATVAWRGLLASRLAVVLVAVGLTGVAVATREAAPTGPLFWLGFNATFVIFILVGLVAHHLYRRTWGRLDCAAVGAALLGLYVVASRAGPATGVARLYLQCSAIALAVFGALFLARDRLPYSAALDRLSNVSYPLYLLHGVNGYVLVRALHALTGNYFLAALVTVGVTIAAAAAVHHWVETPTNDFGRRLSRRAGTARDATPSDALAPSTVP